jgi:hypothetical protein
MYRGPSQGGPIIYQYYKKSELFDGVGLYRRPSVIRFPQQFGGVIETIVIMVLVILNNNKKNVTLVNKQRIIINKLPLVLQHQAFFLGGVDEAIYLCVCLCVGVFVFPFY